MPKGFLSMFDDPVVGPQVALGLLSTGLGLMTSRPNQVPNVIQGGLGQVGQGLLYGGRLRAKEQAEEQELASRRATIEQLERAFGQSASQAAPAGPQAPMYNPGSGTPPWAPQAPQMDAPESMGPAPASRIPPEALELMKAGIMNPGISRTLGPAITQLMQPQSLSKVQEMQQIQQYVDSVLGEGEGKKYVKTSLNLAPRPGEIMRQDALTSYWQTQEARRGASDAAMNADRDRAYGLSASSQAAINADRDASRANQEAYRAQKLKQGGTPTYDAEGNVTGYIGGGGKPLTEGQAKATTNAASAQFAQDQLEQLKEGGFDPASVGGATQVALSDVPVVGGFVSKEAQIQASSNKQLTMALNYARTGATITEVEEKKTQEALQDKMGQPPEVTAFKATSRQVLIDAIQSGSPKVKDIVQGILTGVDQGAGAGVRGSLEISADQPAAAANDDEEVLKRILGR